MLRGSSYHTIDAKGRVIIPARFRDTIKIENRKGVMVTTFDDALVAYPYDEWENVENKILSLAKTSDTMRRFRRVFIGGF